MGVIMNKFISIMLFSALFLTTVTISARNPECVCNNNFWSYAYNWDVPPGSPRGTLGTPGLGETRCKNFCISWNSSMCYYGLGASLRSTCSTEKRNERQGNGPYVPPTPLENLTNDVKSGNLNGVQQAINSNNNLLNQPDGNGSTPLIIAAMNNQPAIVNYLVSAGAELNIQNSYGATALSVAQNKGYQDIVAVIQNAEQSRLQEFNNLVDQYNKCANYQMEDGCGSAQPMQKYTTYSDNLGEEKAQIVQNIANCNQMNTACDNWNPQNAQSLSRLYSPLTNAIKNNNADEVTSLISNLPSSNSLSDLDGFALGEALVEAAKDNNFNIVKILFDNQVNFYLYSNSGLNYLTQAIALGINSSTAYLKRMSRGIIN